MKKPVRITIQKESPKSEITSYQSPFDATETTTVAEFKTILKNSITTPFEPVKETLYNGSVELKDEELITKKLTLFYVLVIK
jgi:hypothetical protein